MGWHQPSKELTPQAAKQSYLPLSVPSPFCPLSEQADRPLAHSSWPGWFRSFALSLLSLLSSPLRLPESCPWGPCLPGEWTALGWLCHFRGSFTQFPWLSCPISNLETSGRMTTWPGGSCGGLSISFLSPLPSPGAGRTEEVSKEPETSGSPSQGKKEPPEAGCSPVEEGSSGGRC